ncbi:MAG: hypothetical protein MHM6MM_000963 [Cercozoa sp. M6MM]
MGRKWKRGGAKHQPKCRADETGVNPTSDIKLILVSCDQGKERECRQEVSALLDDTLQTHFADVTKDEADEKSTSSETSESAELDLDDALAAELAELTGKKDENEDGQAKKKKRVYAFIRQSYAPRGLLLVQVIHPEISATSLVTKAIESVTSPVTRRTVRMLPFERTAFAKTKQAAMEDSFRKKDKKPEEGKEESETTTESTSEEVPSTETSAAQAETEADAKVSSSENVWRMGRIIREEVSRFCQARPDKDWRFYVEYKKRANSVSFRDEIINEAKKAFGEFGAQWGTRDYDTVMLAHVQAKTFGVNIVPRALYERLHGFNLRKWQKNLTSSAFASSSAASTTSGESGASTGDKRSAHEGDRAEAPPAKRARAA